MTDDKLLEQAIKRATKVQALDLEALADKYRDTVRADGYHGLAPWRYGWSIRDAFVVGMLFGEARASKGNIRPKKPPQT